MNDMLYQILCFIEGRMSDSHHHSHHHSHPMGTRHPPDVVVFSLLRMSALGRLALIVPIVLLLWVAAFAVLQGGI